jgi:serine/threonine-protein kinase HipA
MSDQSAAVWTRASGQPKRLGLLVRAGTVVRFTYDREAGGLPGLSVAHDTEVLAGRTVEFKRSEQNPLPPMFQALVPPQDRANLQRRILRAILENEVNLAGLPPEDVDWLMLIKAGRDSIGHLDVFASDEAAKDWYAAPAPSLVLGGELQHRLLWKLVVEATSPVATSTSIEEIVRALRIHPSPGGVMPKLLARLNDPDLVGDVLIKVSSPDYPHVLALESLAYEFHESVGTKCPRRIFRRTDDGIELLAVERFDREGGNPVPLESIFTTLYTATNGSPARVEDRWSNEGTTPNLEMVGQLLRTPAVAASVRPKVDREEFYKRQVMALLTGNGDNHLENTALRGGRGSARLSPLFDPAPMRGYHDKQMISSVSFGGLAFHKGNIPSEIGGATVALGSEFGLSKPRSIDVIERCLEATSDFAERVRAVAPSRYGEALIIAVEGVRGRIEGAVSEARPSLTVSSGP